MTSEETNARTPTRQTETRQAHRQAYPDTDASGPAGACPTNRRPAERAEGAPGAKSWSLLDDYPLGSAILMFNPSEVGVRFGS